MNAGNIPWSQRVDALTLCERDDGLGNREDNFTNLHEHGRQSCWPLRTWRRPHKRGDKVLWLPQMRPEAHEAKGKYVSTSWCTLVGFGQCQNLQWGAWDTFRTQCAQKNVALPVSTFRTQQSRQNIQSRPSWQKVGPTPKLPYTSWLFERFFKCLER